MRKLCALTVSLLLILFSCSGMDELLSPATELSPTASPIKPSSSIAVRNNTCEPSIFVLPPQSPSPSEFVSEPPAISPSPSSTPSSSFSPIPSAEPSPMPSGAQIIEVTGNNVQTTPQEATAVPVAMVIISVNRKATYEVGETCVFDVQMYPEDATDKSYSADINGATAIDGQNAVYCGAAGEVTITITAASGAQGSQMIRVIDIAAYAGEVLRLTNLEREKEGIAALTATSGLTDSAMQRAEETTVSFSHTRPDGDSCFTVFDENNVSYGWAGENIAYGQRTPEEVVQDWIDSPDHKENIMNHNFSHLGVGVAINDDGSLYWVQCFTD